jgi:translation initiation factor 5A
MPISLSHLSSSSSVVLQENMSDHEGDGKEGQTRPLKASAFRKGSYILLKGKPCKIVEMTTSKTGKHGHAKVKFVGVDIFTGKKYQELQGSTHAMDEVIVVKSEYTVMDIDDDGNITSLDDEDGEGPPLQIDTDPNTENEVHKALWEDFQNLPDDKEIVIGVTTAMGAEAIQSHKLNAI